MLEATLRATLPLPHRRFDKRALAGAAIKETLDDPLATPLADVDQPTPDTTTLLRCLCRWCLPASAPRGPYVATSLTRSSAGWCLTWTTKTPSRLGTAPAITRQTCTCRTQQTDTIRRSICAKVLAIYSCYRALAFVGFRPPRLRRDFVHHPDNVFHHFFYSMR
jgi:hypothetical protein